jgi:hypothetical protein
MRQGNGDVDDGLCPQPGNRGAAYVFNGMRNAVKRVSDPSTFLFAQTQPRGVVRAKIYVALAETDSSTATVVWNECVWLAHDPIDISAYIERNATRLSHLKPGAPRSA